MPDNNLEDDLQQDIAGSESLARELEFLFGGDIVEQAQLVDSADLNMTDDMTAAVREGIAQLKNLKRDPEAQRQWVRQQPAGLQLLLCLWIMDMDMLDKIQEWSYL